MHWCCWASRVNGSSTVTAVACGALVRLAERPLCRTHLLKPDRPLSAHKLTKLPGVSGHLVLVTHRFAQE